MRIPLALALVAYSISPAFADAKRAKQVKALHAAIARGPEAVKPLVKPGHLFVQGVHFASSDCESSFGRARDVGDGEIATLAECMKAMKLVLDGEVLVAEPGVEIEALFDGGKLMALTATEAVRATRAAKQLAATANIEPDAESKALVAKKKAPFLAVDISLCLDTNGAAAIAFVQRYNVVDAGRWADQLLAATKAATYAPFMRYGTPVRVCTHQLHVYPATKRKAGLAELERLALADDEGGEEGGTVGGVIGGPEDSMLGAPPPPPPPPPPPQNVPPTLLEGSRIAGTKVIVPDDETKKKIVASGKDKVVASFKLCITAKGEVASVTMLKSSGFADYDTLIMREMNAWKYRPYAVNGRAVPVCTAITFIYSQK